MTNAQGHRAYGSGFGRFRPKSHFYALFVWKSLKSACDAGKSCVFAAEIKFCGGVA